VRLIVAGTRTFTDRERLYAELDRRSHVISEIVHGGAPGADRLAWDWAIARDVASMRFPAQWEKYGRAAGPIRNAEMAKYGNELLAFWDGRSPGTANMIAQANARWLPVTVISI
jgi:hypothetical protein